ncbi:hypothetical protein [Lysinibacillus sp. NPDC092081]|uniref:hypothetical protein n=1 Tax=Lysinibacillus sp. NPDC092081 TaxID=3364131 RepID=UPI0037F24130
MKQNINDNNMFFEKYQEIRAREYNYNNLLEQPNFFTLISPLKNKIVLEIGCGMGDFAADNYQDEGLRSQNWLVDDVVTYLRTMSTILNTLIESGLQIEKIIEPIPTKEAVCNLEFRRLSFLIIRAKWYRIRD